MLHRGDAEPNRHGGSLTDGKRELPVPGAETLSVYDETIVARCERREHRQTRMIGHLAARDPKICIVDGDICPLHNAAGGIGDGDVQSGQLLPRSGGNAQEEAGNGKQQTFFMTGSRKNRFALRLWNGSISSSCQPSVL